VQDGKKKQSDAGITAWDVVSWDENLKDTGRKCSVPELRYRESS